MKKQSTQRLAVAGGQLVPLIAGGELKVIEGKVWLTRLGDLDDHLLEPGQKIRIRASEHAIIESWRPTDTVQVQWQPRPQTLPSLVLAETLRALAGLAAGVGLGFAALARSAASSARRAQGRICAGDSIASSGALK